jgi:hypothetical protein
MMPEIEDFMLIDQLKLMGYGESDTQGAWIKFQVEDIDEFRGKKGSLFEVAIREIDNSGNYIKPSIHLRLTALELAADAEFLAFAAEQVHCPSGQAFDESDAAIFIKEECGIEHRSELDHNETAARKFAELRTRFLNWKREQ